MKMVGENLASFEFIRSDPENSAIFCDIDGTLSEIAPSPEEAVIDAKMRAAVSKAAGRYQLVVISGRPARQARSMVDDDRIIYLGNHGLEHLVGDEMTSLGSPRQYRTIAGAKNDLESLVSQISGIRLEDKGLALAIHYRQAERESEARKLILSQIIPVAEREGLEIIMGRKVIEIKSKLGDKGEAMEAVIGESGRGQVIYLGDDRTDVAAFKKLKELRLRGKLSGYALGLVSNETPEEITAEADFCFRSVAEVEEFLEWLTNKKAEIDPPNVGRSGYP